MIRASPPRPIRAVVEGSGTGRPVMSTAIGSVARSALTVPFWLAVSICWLVNSGLSDALATGDSNPSVNTVVAGDALRSPAIIKVINVSVFIVIFVCCLIELNL